MDGLLRAIGYGLEAARLLGRRPSLLLLAAALGSYSAVDTVVMNSYFRQHTALAKDIQRWEQSVPRKDRPTGEEARDRRARQAQARLAITSPSGPGLDAGATLVVGWSLLYGPPGKDLDPAHTPPVVTVYLIVLWALSGPVPIGIMVYTGGGFLTLVKELVASGEVRWRTLRPGARRVFWRLLLLNLLFLLFHFLLGSVAGRAGAAGEVVSWLLVGAALPLALADFAVVWDDCSALEALARSARVVTRNLPAALVLVVAAGLVQWLVQQPQLAAWEQATRTGGAVRVASLLPRALLGMAVVYIAGAWFCAVGFVWYRTAADRPAATEKAPVKAAERGWWEQ